MNSQTAGPREIALQTHENYYAQGNFSADRLTWTLNTFLPPAGVGQALEIGCGDGAMLNLLAERGINAVGVDASSSGIEECVSRGCRAHCLDASTDNLPFEDESFDLVICLETIEHLMNPHYALSEVRRVLRPHGRFLCSIPNPLTGHPFLYPGLFEYKSFQLFLRQEGFAIQRVLPWQWAPRETILPISFRQVPLLNSRVVSGGLRRILEKSYRAVGAFPFFCYWLWTFQCERDLSFKVDPHQLLARRTQPGTPSHFTVSR